MKGGFPLAILKYSRQRESIKDYLANTSEHPTADTIYLNVKESFPNISLGTVYRNLNLLADLGEAVKISIPHSSDRFDGRTFPHNHFVCISCGKVIDLEMDSIENINDLAGKHFDGEILSHSTLFYGNCADCLEHSAKKRYKN